MKKYIKPNTKIVLVGIQRMIAVSNLTISNTDASKTGTDYDDAKTSTFSIWSDSDEEE